MYSYTSYNFSVWLKMTLLAIKKGILNSIKKGILEEGGWIRFERKILKGQSRESEINLNFMGCLSDTQIVGLSHPKKVGRYYFWSKYNLVKSISQCHFLPITPFDYMNRVQPVNRLIMPVGKKISAEIPPIIRINGQIDFNIFCCEGMSIKARVRTGKMSKCRDKSTLRKKH